MTDKLLLRYLQYLVVVAIFVFGCSGCSKNSSEIDSGVDTKVITWEKPAAERPNQNAHEKKTRQNVVESPIYVLVVVDTSGSMSKTHFIVQDILQLVDVFSQVNPILKVEYISFNADEAEFVSKEELNQKFASGRETSVYKGMQKTKEWIDEYCNNMDATDKRVGILVLSDLFSSRTKDNVRYNKDSAKEEQEELIQWMDDWNQKERAGKLSLCFVTWESLIKNEEKEKTYKLLEKEKDSENAYKNGFQVVMDERGDNTFFLDSKDIKEENELAILEKDTVKYCLKQILDLIVGEDDIKQEDERKSERRKDYILFENNDKYCQVFLQISPQMNTQKDIVKIKGIKKTIDNHAEPEEISATKILGGIYTDLYYVKNADQYQEIYIESKNCVASLFGVVKQEFKIHNELKKGNFKYYLQVDVEAVWSCGIREKTLKVEVLDSNDKIISTSNIVVFYEDNKKYKFEFELEKRPKKVNIYELGPNDEWQLMKEKDVI